MDIAELSIRRPVTIIMAFVSLVVIGGIAALRLPLEYFPAVDAPFAFVNVPYSGSTPAEVERNITRPIEEALSTIGGIKRLNSFSRSEASQMFMEFDWTADVAIKTSEVRDRIDAIRAELPSDLQRIFVQRFTPSDQPVMALRLGSEQDLSKSYDLIERKLRRPLERLPGVARVELNGLSAPEVEIALDADRLTAHGVDLATLNQRLRSLNFSVSAGTVRDGPQRLRVQPEGEFTSLDDMRNLAIDDKGLRLSDVADVHLQPARLTVRRHLDLKPAVGLDVFKEREANLVTVGRLVLDEIEKIKQDPELQGIQLYLVQDQASGVTQSLAALAEAGFIGSVLSVIVLFFFLRHWPSTLMISAAVPLCLVITLGVMYFLGISLNVLSMMGLLLGVGMVVDNGVVAVESIYQEREKMPGDPQRAATLGVRNVAIALSAGTLCHCIVFLPNIFGAKNFLSIYLSHVAYAISISLLSSWLVAVTLVPLFASRMPAPKFVHQHDSLIGRLRDRYADFIAWTLVHRTKTILGLTALMLLTVVPMKLVKVDMFPADATRKLQLQYDLNGVYTLDQMEANVRKVEDWLTAHKEELEIIQVYSYMNEDFGGGTYVTLKENGKLRTEDVKESIAKGLPKLAIGEVGFGQNRGGGGQALQVSVIGDSGEELRKLGDTIIPILKRVPGLRDVRTDDASANHEIAIHVDRERAAAYGFSAEQVATFIAVAIRGAPLSEFRSGDREVPVWLRFGSNDRRSVDDLRDLKLKRADGSLVPLLSMVDVKMSETPSAIGRQDRQTALPIKLNLAKDATESDVRKNIEKAMNSIALPAGYRWSFGGGFNDSNDALNQMLFNTLLALVMIYVVMAALFESLLFPAAIVTSIVFSIFGVYWMFLFTHTTFSITAFIGILILMGVVVNNGIVMVEHINQLRHSGQSRTDALVHGSRDRLRPVLMTMGTAILGMVPLCVSNTQIGGDGPPYYPMARAIAGGLIFSTAVTLLVLPAIYAIFDDWRNATAAMVKRARERARRWHSTATGAEPTATT